MGSGPSAKNVREQGQGLHQPRHCEGRAYCPRGDGREEAPPVSNWEGAEPVSDVIVKAGLLAQGVGAPTPQ